MATKRSNIPSNLAVGYIRVSTIQQIKAKAKPDSAEELKVSLALQEERIRAYCSMAGLELVNILREEAVSASIDLIKRPAGSQLPTILKRGVSHIVALKLDRLFRGAENALGQTRKWDKDGVSLHLIDFGGTAINTASSMGRMILTMMAGFAEFERNLISERTTAALSYKRQHRIVFNHPPFGYRRDGSMLVVEPAEQETISHIREQRLAGLPLRKIAAGLNASGTPTKRPGGQWFASTVVNVLQSNLHE